MSVHVARAAAALVSFAVPAGLVATWLGEAEEHLEIAAGRPPPAVAVASMTEDSYCTAELKGIVRRVAGACGLLEGATGRGCQPSQARNLVQLTGPDFNALFRPLSKRARIIQFEADRADLDEGARAAVEAAWSDQRGASFFFVVARASHDGKADYNERLSRSRAEAVLGHLQARFDDPDIRKEVGLMWLGEEYAQLDAEFCGWTRSRESECTGKEINRSAFVAWIDCAI